MTHPELDPPYLEPHYATLPPAIAQRSLRHDPAFEVAEEMAVTRLDAPAIGKPRIVSSAHGPIRHILLWFPAYSEDEFDLGPVYGDLLATLPEHTRITIAADPTSIDRIEAIAESRRPSGNVETFPVPEWLAFTVWAEDAFVVVEDVSAQPPKRYLMEPWEFPRAADQLLAELVANASDMGVAQAPLSFQGGNILVGDDFVLIGADYLEDSVEIAPRVFDDLGADTDVDAYVAEKFRQLFDPDRQIHFLRSSPNRPPPPPPVRLPDGRVFEEVVYYGEGRQQPIFHIDMFVSLAGRDGPGSPYRVLVGDPGMAATLLGEEPTAFDLQSEFDDVANQLSELGFEVIRSPLPRAYVDQLTQGRDTSGRPIDVIQRLWYHATSNNCLVQIDGLARQVWLPTYAHGPWGHLASTDMATVSIWEGLGFTCNQLGDFHPFASRLGALHCIKKYLGR